MNRDPIVVIRCLARVLGVGVRVCCIAEHYVIFIQYASNTTNHVILGHVFFFFLIDVDIDIDRPLSTSLRRTLSTPTSIPKMTVDLSNIEAHLSARSYVEG